jgi:competence protein ComEC
MNNKRNKFKVFSIVIVAGFIICAICFKRVPILPAQTQAPSTAHVIFLNVGQGDAALIEKDNMQILIDGGDGQQILNRLGETMPFADKEIDLLILSHPDEDHMGGLVKVLESYRVDKIMESGIDCDKDICKKWDALIAQDGIPVTDAKLGDDIRFGNDIDIDVLYPFEDIKGKEFKDTNASSLILKANVVGRKYLFTGDAEDNVEKEILDSNINLDADVLKISHHGSKSATSALFLQAVSPQTAVISVGKNTYGHPTEEVLTRLRNMNIEILRTDEKGNIKY